MSVSELGKRLAGLTGAGLHSLLGSRVGGSLGMLLYHRVAEPVPELPKPQFNVSPEQFRKQITGLADSGFRFRPLREVLRCRNLGEPVSPQTVVLTFDDVYRSVYLNAWPVLRELNIPATMFISTAYLDCDEPFPFDPWGTAYRETAPPDTYAPLTSAQCREMAESGLIELGSHTHTHGDFRGRPERFRWEVQTSLEILQTSFGAEDIPFAFPYGRVGSGHAGDDLVEAARESGVTCALTTECDPVDLQSDPFCWGRFNAYDWDTAGTLAAKLQGWYGWAPKLQERLSQVIRAGKPRKRRRAATAAGGDTSHRTSG